MLTTTKFDTIFGLVTNVVDGDTFDILVVEQTVGNQFLYNTAERIRIATINAPELPSISGFRAKVALELAIAQKRVKCFVQTRDVFGRLVCQVQQVQ